MKNLFKVKAMLRIVGIIALAAVIGFSMAACKEDENDKDGGNKEKSIKITGLDEFINSSYELGLADSVPKLVDEDLVAFAEGTIKKGIQTEPLLDYKNSKPWTGSGSYFVGVRVGDDAYVTKSKKSFNSEVTTLDIDDFEPYDDE